MAHARRFFSSFLFLVALLLIPTITYAQVVDWHVVVQGKDHSVLRMEMSGEKGAGSCSAVVYQIDADKQALALTAAHCVRDAKDVTVNRRHTETVLSNNLLDLAVVTFKAKDEVPLPLAAVDPTMGTPVAVLGYAFGIKDLAGQFGNVSQLVNSETQTMWINVDLIFGDSGGAVINAKGELVGINSKIASEGPAHMGMAVMLEDIKEFLKAVERELKKKG